ncbi:MAG: RDD family protein [Nitrososphaera sp.]|nr:RDD family protein [Nitrososphaera sp.]
MSSDTSSSSPPGDYTELVLAKWIDRFFAWLIDFVIVNIVLWALFAAVAFPFWFDGMPDNWFSGAEGPTRWAVTSLVFFAYWIYFESTTGQSLGKLVLRLKTTDLSGGRADIRNVVIQSFGKAFLLPIDVILGWIFSNDKRQRIFSRAGNTVVIKLKDAEKGGSSEVRYTKE